MTGSTGKLLALHNRLAKYRDRYRKLPMFVCTVSEELAVNSMCGPTEESSAEWIDPYRNDEYGEVGLVVCPGCDCVLGVMATEINW
jgi:hypothetical protein